MNEWPELGGPRGAGNVQVWVFLRIASGEVVVSATLKQLLSLSIFRCPVGGEQPAEPETRRRFRSAETSMGRGVKMPSSTGVKGMIDQVREHMEVIGADGVHVGTVDKVEGGRIS